MGTREQEAGKDRVATLTIWTLHMPGVSFRVLATDPDGNCQLHTKRGSGRWVLSTRGGTARELFDHVTRTVYQAWGRVDAKPAEGAPGRP